MVDLWPVRYDEADFVIQQPPCSSQYSERDMENLAYMKHVIGRIAT